ncbi:hypothetical protein AWW67_14195 [Roseivirga seohaensis]|uniref:Lipoprotein n=1 Tax=Roseivirga seohaensis TaxID=1914963 RepID=A0A150Y3B3_9BACT|nr:hypothetical protein AWW67_14195 [Roseivirga seohaensis]
MKGTIRSLISHSAIRSILEKFFIAIILLTTFSCNKREDIAEYQTFPNEFIVANDLEEIPIEVDLFIVTEMAATDSLLFTLLYKGDEVVKIFDNQTLEYLGGFGSEGEGPNEFFYPYQNGFRVYEGNVLSMVDRKSIRTIQVSIQKDSNNKRVATSTLDETQRHQLAGVMMPLNEGSLLNDSTVIGLNQTSEDSQFITFDFVNKKIDYAHQFPPINIEATPFEMAHWLNSYMKISRDHSKIAIAYEKIPLIRVIDLKEYQSTEVLMKTEEAPIADLIVDSEGRPIKTNGIIYYYDMEISNEYIFAGYHKKEISYSENNEPQHINHSGNEIHVFDFQGNALAKLKLDDWMRQFAVTPNSSYLYFSHPEKENSIFRYELPKFK